MNIGECECAHSHTCLWRVCRFAAYCDHSRSPPDTSRVPLHQGHNGAIRRLIMLVRSTGRPARRQSRTASLMAHYSLLNDHADDPNSRAGCPHSACLKQHFTPLAKVHSPRQLRNGGFVFSVLVVLARLFIVQSEN